MVILPADLIKLRDQVIDHVTLGDEAQYDIKALVTWYEEEHEEIVAGWGPEEHVALDLKEIAAGEFNDIEMGAYEGSDLTITDDRRIAHAKNRLEYIFEETGSDVSPSIHAVEIKNENGSTAVLGWTMRFEGYSPVVEFQGAFSTKEHFYQFLRINGFLLDSDMQTLKGETILELWEKPTKR
jgi:hypothetical protein